VTRRSAAGILFTDGGRVLLLRRSGAVTDSFTWGLRGGRMEPGEIPLETAVRESDEEMGDTPLFWLSGVYQVPGYTTFIATVADPSFRPQLNLEHTEYRWVKLPQVASLRLHPGFALAWPALRRRVSALQSPSSGDGSMAKLDELITGARGRIRDRRLAALVQRARTRKGVSVMLKPKIGDVFVQEVERFGDRWYSFFAVIGSEGDRVDIQPVASRDVMRTARRGTRDASSNLVAPTDVAVGPPENRAFKILRLPRRADELVVVRGADELYLWDGEPLVEIHK